jgi:cation diffusion facilitator CzcD-associated flavoprotein CzcO
VAEDTLRSISTTAEDHHKVEPVRVAIIGSGFSDLGMAIRLRGVGIDDLFRNRFGGSAT